MMLIKVIIIKIPAIFSFIIFLSLLILKFSLEPPPETNATKE